MSFKLLNEVALLMQEMYISPLCGFTTWKIHMELPCGESKWNVHANLPYGIFT